MQQIKVDLKVLSSNRVEHLAFVNFTRDLISLIKSHGSDICPVDDFFYQVSNEYSPPLQDPRLHVAGIVSYGIRLAEGDGKVVAQLFHYLLTNFKVSLAHNKLPDEADMLVEGMKNSGILSFVLGTMLPAVIQAATQVHNAYPILDVYVHSLRTLLTRSPVPIEIPLADAQHIVSLVGSILSGIGNIKRSVDGELSSEQLHVIRQLVSLVDMLRSTYDVMAFGGNEDQSLLDLEAQFEAFGVFASQAERHIESAVREAGDSIDIEIVPELLLAGLDLSGMPTGLRESRVANFANTIADDVRKNWMFMDGMISIKAPGASRGVTSTQSPQGLKRPPWDMTELLYGLLNQFRVWNDWFEDWNEAAPRTSKEVRWLEVPFI